MNSVTGWKDYRRGGDGKVLELTLVDTAFVLPVLEACGDERMVADGLLDQHFVLQLLHVIIEDYLKSKTRSASPPLPSASFTFDFSRTFTA